MAGFLIKADNSDQLVLSRSQWRHFRQALVLLVFACVWYYFLLQELLPTASFTDAIIEQLMTKPFLIIFYGAGVVLLYKSAGFMREAIRGERYLFLKTAGEIQKDRRVLAMFSDVEHIVVDGASNHILLEMKESSVPTISIISDSINIATTSSQLAVILGVNKIKKMS